MHQIVDELVSAGLLRISDDGMWARICVPQYGSCLECPFVRVTDYEELYGSDVMYGPDGCVYAIALSGVCGFSGDVLLDFNTLPNCRFLKNALKRQQKYELWKKQRKLEYVANLRERVEKQMDMLTNPSNFKRQYK